MGNGSAGGPKHIGQSHASDFVAAEPQSVLTGKPLLPLQRVPAALGIRQTVTAWWLSPSLGNLYTSYHRKPGPSQCKTQHCECFVWGKDSTHRSALLYSKQGRRCTVGAKVRACRQIVAWRWSNSNRHLQWPPATAPSAPRLRIRKPAAETEGLTEVKRHRSRRKNTGRCCRRLRRWAGADGHASWFCVVGIHLVYTLGSVWFVPAHKKVVSS